MRRSQRVYCSRNGRSSPRRWRSAAICAGSSPMSVGVVAGRELREQQRAGRHREDEEQRREAAAKQKSHWSAYRRVGPWALAQRLMAERRAIRRSRGSWDRAAPARRRRRGGSARRHLRRDEVDHAAGARRRSSAPRAGAAAVRPSVGAAHLPLHHRVDRLFPRRRARRGSRRAPGPPLSQKSRFIAGSSALAWKPK